MTKLTGLFLLLALPAFAGDSGSDVAPKISEALRSIRCVDGPKEGCVTCASTKTEQFQVVCGLPVSKPAKGGKK